MKKYSKILLLLALLALTALVVVSCGPNASGEIKVKEDGMPQLVYVKGNELDLSNGILTVTDSTGTREVALNDANVEVSGYDKNTLGEQKLTITYQGATTTLTVTVVERMQAIDVTTEYLQGDELDLNTGRLQITRDNGTNYTVLLGSDKVTVTGFDGETASKQTLKATYNTGSETYEASFDVTVYAIENVVFHRPNKVAYESHEKGIDLSGGYFTLKGHGMERDVALEEDWVEGFDLSAVNAENTPYDQTVTIKYDNKSYEYTVKLTYTPISAFISSADQFAELDWTVEDEDAEFPEITPELGELSLELMDLFLEMSKAERALIPAETSMSVVRAAFAYGFGILEEEVVALEGAFTIYQGELSLTCESYDAVKAAAERLESEDCRLVEVSALLEVILAEFEEEEFYAGALFGDYTMPSAEVYAGLADVFVYMTEVYDLFAEIPENWATVGVKTYEDQIKNIYTTITESEYNELYGAQIYYPVSSWRPAGDSFDILYTYYYGEGDIEALLALANFRLPSALEEIASYILMALDEIDSISGYMQYDTSLLIYNYYMANRTAAALLASDDQMMKDLYALLPVNTLLGIDPSVSFQMGSVLEYLRTVDGGFYHFSGGLLGIEEYHALMDKYMDIVIRIFEDESYDGSEEYNEDIEEMFAMFIALSPTQRFNFMSTLNAYYGMGIPSNAFDDSGENAYFTCVFVQLINEYYRGKFESEASHAAYNDLIIAYEMYAKRFATEDWLTPILEKMANVQDVYSHMSDADQAAFDFYLRDLYDDFSLLLTRFEEPEVETDLGEWQETFDALGEAILNVEMAYYLIENEYPLYNMFFSAYERAQALVDYILAEAPQTIVDAYMHETLYRLEDMSGGTGEEGTETGGEEPIEIAWSYDYVMNLYRTIYINYQLTLMEGSSIYDFYTENDLAAFENACYDLIWTYLYSEEGQTDIFDREKVIAILNAFPRLDIDSKVLFMMMEGEYGFYYTAISVFLEENFTEAATDVAYQVLTLEQNLLLYETMPEEANLAAVEDTLATLKDMHKALEGEDKESFNDLEALYNYYVAAAEEAIAKAGTAAA